MPVVERGFMVRRVEAGGRRHGFPSQGRGSIPVAEILRSPIPVGTAIAVTPGHAAVGHVSAPDDIVVFALDGDGPRVAHKRVSASGYA